MTLLPSPGTGGITRAFGVAGLLSILLLPGCAPVGTGSGSVHPALVPALEARLDRERGSVEVLARLGAAYREAGQPEAAREVLEEAVRLDPESATVRLLLGVVYEETGALDGAAELYESYLDAGEGGELDSTVRGRLAAVRRKQLEAWARDAAAREEALADRDPGPATVAVLPFRYVGGDPDLSPLARALSEILVTDLSQTARLTVLERLRVRLLLGELELAASGRVDPATAARGGRIMGAGRLVQGRIDGSEESLTLEAAVVAVGPEGAGDVGSPVASEAPASDFFDAERRLALALFEELGVELTSAERERVGDRPTENVQALLAYGLGLEAEDRGDFDAAAEHFRRAAELDPGFERARVRAREIGALRTALDGGTDALATGVYTTAFTEPLLSDWLTRRFAFRELELVFPQMLVRDPSAELLGAEGIAPDRALLEFILRRP